LTLGFPRSRLPLVQTAHSTGMEAEVTLGIETPQPEGWRSRVACTSLVGFWSTHGISEADVYPIWIVDRDQEPVAQVGAMDDPEVALLRAAQILKSFGSPALDARNLDGWDGEPSLLVYDPTTTLPYGVVVVGSVLTEPDGELAQSSVGFVALWPAVNE